MVLKDKIIEIAIKRPKFVALSMILGTVIIAALAVLPSIWPNSFPSLHSLKIDTDPENMLPHDEPVRVFHDRMKKELSLYDMLVVGVVNESNPNGVFNVDTLRNIHTLTEYAKTLHWQNPDRPNKTEGIIVPDIISPSTVDSIEQAGLGAVSFKWLMSSVPSSNEEALKIRDMAKRIPFLNGTLVSEDGKALALYLPLSSKDLSHKVSQLLQEKISEFHGDDEFYITGLPVAEGYLRI